MSVLLMVNVVVIVAWTKKNVLMPLSNREMSSTKNGLCISGRTINFFKLSIHKLNFGGENYR